MDTRKDGSSALGTDLSKTYKITVPIGEEFYKIEEPLVSSCYFDCATELIYKQLFIEEYKDAKTKKTIKEEHIGQVRVRLASPYVVGWEWCWNYKYLLGYDLEKKTVTFRYFPFHYNDIGFFRKIYILSIRIMDYKLYLKYIGCRSWRNIFKLYA